MAVVIETTLGDITVDLYLDQRPVTCLNFLKLCKMKYYNFNLFHSIRSGFIAQTGDPTGEGSGGQSIFGVLEGPSKRFFSGEKMPKIRHTNAGLLSMVCTGDMMVGSQFFFTLAPDLDSLDGVHCVIGEVTEGQDVLRKLNEVICDDTHRPYQDVRITHTVILEDPFNDPAGFRAPSRSPSPSAERLKGGRIAPDEEIDETQGKTTEEIQEMIEEKEAKARATILEIVGDLPDADIAPPENVLFVCKLNPVTSDEDLEIIFSRFGKIVSCEVIRDKKTGDSLQYAFIEFADKKSCEDAYFKMDNVLIDDRRIHVDFSQSVSKMRYLGKGRGVKYLDDNDTDYKNNHINNKLSSSKNYDKDKGSKRNHDSDRNHISERNHYEHRSNTKEKNHKSKQDTNNHRNRSRSRSQHRREDTNIERRDRSRERKHEKEEQDRARDRKYEKQEQGRSRDRKYEKEEQDRSRDRKHEKVNSNSLNNTKRAERSERSTKDNHNHKHREHNSNSRNLKSQHSPKEKSKSPERKDKDNFKRPREDKQVSDKHSRKEKAGNSNRDTKESKDIQDKKSKKRTPKRKREDSEPPRENKKAKKLIDHSENDRNLVPRTPTPIEKKHSEKSMKSKQRKEEKVTKKRRKYSTSSSDSDSSDSSSTSVTSTSSEDRGKRRRTRRRKRRCSSSSSSSDSSDSSSSTSSSSETSSSSSSSDSEPRRKKRSKNVSHKKSKRK